MCWMLDLEKRAGIVYIKRYILTSCLLTWESIFGGGEQEAYYLSNNIGTWTSVVIINWKVLDKMYLQASHLSFTGSSDK